MSATKETLLREKGFGFFGAITASLSHQMNNVLATINELSGLLDDFLLAAEKGKPLDPERLRKATQRIAAQVERGQDYIKRLNRFAHTVDEPTGVIDVRDSLEALSLLCRRFATLKRAELHLDLGTQAPVLEGCIFDFQHIVFRGLRIALAAAEEGDRIEVRLLPSADGVRVTITGQSPVGDIAQLRPLVEFFELLVAELRGQTVVELETDAPIALSLLLPRRLRPAD